MYTTQVSWMPYVNFPGCTYSRVTFSNITCEIWNSKSLLQIWAVFFFIQNLIINNSGHASAGCTVTWLYWLLTQPNVGDIFLLPAAQSIEQNNNRVPVFWVIGFLYYLMAVSKHSFYICKLTCVMCCDKVAA